jgi:hypothetical protein
MNRLLAEMLAFSGHCGKPGKLDNHLIFSIDYNSFCYFLSLSISVIPGNLYVYLSVKTEVITRSTRYLLFSAFSVVCALGLVVFAIMVWRFIIERRRLQQQQLQEKVTLASMKDTLIIALRLLKTKNILFLLASFAYTGKSFRK